MFLKRAVAIQESLEDFLFNYQFLKVSPNLEKSDTNTHLFTIAGRYPSIITDSWKKSTILFVTNSETQSVIYSLDVFSQNSQPHILLTIPLNNSKSEIIGDARYVDDGNALAFITAGGPLHGLK